LGFFKTTEHTEDTEVFKPCLNVLKVFIKMGWAKKTSLINYIGFRPESNA